MPCDREKINCKDGTQGVLIGSDPERKLADDFRVRAIRRKKGPPGYLGEELDRDPLPPGR